MKVEVSVSGTGKGVPRMTKKLDVPSLAAVLRRVASLACPTHHWKPKASTGDDDDSVDVLDVCCVQFRDHLLESLRSCR